MKTIFVTAFEGVEAKNILRTDVLAALLRDPEARLVVFMKNAERVDWYRGEFSDPRITYEIVPRPRVSGLDAVFARLKFTLLRTDSTRLRRRLAAERTGRYARYAVSRAANWLLARPLVRRCVRAADYALVRTDHYRRHFDAYRPDLVFMAHLFDEPEAHLLREAKRRGVKTVGLINSWDKVTARCMLRLLPDTLLVFNSVVKEEAIAHNEMPAERIMVCGLPQYDVYVRGVRSTRDKFFEKIGVPSNRKLIVYGPAGSAYSDADWSVIDYLYALNAAGKFGENAAVFVRFQPNDFIDRREIEKRPLLAYDYPGIRFSSKRGVDWDMDVHEIAHLADTLRHMSLFISYGSSMTVDAALFDKPVIHLGFVPHTGRAPHTSPVRFYEMNHNKNVQTTGGARLVKNEEELCSWVRKYCADPGLDREGRKRLVEQQCAYTDGKAGERIGSFLLKALEA